MTCDEKEDIDNPPDAKSSQRQEFANSGPGLVQAETIQAQKAKENRVEEGGGEVVVGVLDAGHTGPQKDAWTATLDTIKGPATD